MTEAQLLKIGFYLLIIAVAALVLYLVLSLLMLVVRRKNEVSGDYEYRRDPGKYEEKSKVGLNRSHTEEKKERRAENTVYSDVKNLTEEDEYDLEKKIIGSTEALTKISEGSHSANYYRGFLSKDVREIIIPKERMIAVRKGTKIDGVLHHMVTNNISHCPVYYRSIDDILGLVSLKTLLKKRVASEGGDDTWDDCIDTPPFISGNISIQTAFQQMRQKNSKIAIVIDEYAQTIGIVTEDDIICGILNDNQQK